MDQLHEFHQFLREQRDGVTAMDIKARISRSFAASYLWNNRNLEGPWYGRSAQVWHDLTSPFPSMVVVPQYPLWLSEEDQGDFDGGADEGDMDNLQERDADETATRAQGQNELVACQLVFRVEPDDDDQNCIEVDTTEDSMITIPERNASELLPDFVILHFRTRQLPSDHPRFVQLAGIRITHECCPIIIENKRLPKRRTDAALFNEGFHNDLQSRLFEAMSQLETQCAYAFKKYRHALSIIAVAVAGDYWCHLSVPFNVVCPVDDEYTVIRSDWNSLHWPVPIAFGTSESDRRLGELRSVLERKTRN
jgi:hypothetical protein